MGRCQGESTSSCSQSSAMRPKLLTMSPHTALWFYPIEVAHPCCMASFLVSCRDLRAKPPAALGSPNTRDKPTSRGGTSPASSVSTHAHASPGELRASITAFTPSSFRPRPKVTSPGSFSKPLIEVRFPSLTHLPERPWLFLHSSNCWDHLTVWVIPVRSVSSTEQGLYLFCSRSHNQLSAQCLNVVKACINVQ